MANETYINKKGMGIKDLVTTGIFTALTFVLVMTGGGFFAVNPVLTFYMPLGSALLAGPVFLLLIAKTAKRGPITIMGILFGVFFFATGMHWALPMGYILMGITADIVSGVWKYKSVKINILAYMIFSLGGTGCYLVYFINPQSWGNLMINNGTDPTYIETMNASAQGWIPFVILLGTLSVAAFSGWSGSKLLKKQFEKAGIIA